MHKRDCATLATGNEAAVKAKGGARTHKNIDVLTRKFSIVASLFMSRINF